MIHRAAGRGDVATASLLLDRDPALIHERNELDNQPLHDACWAKHLPMVCLLIDRGADVNARGDFGETPLHYAVRDDGTASVPIVARLLEAGAKVEAKDERLKQNPLGFALREFNEDLQPAIQMLLAAGSSIGLEGAMILGDVARVREILGQSDEELDIGLGRAVLPLARDCRQDEIVELIEAWLEQKSGG
jgi:ankyrin repeat protein